MSVIVTDSTESSEATEEVVDALDDVADALEDAADAATDAVVLEQTVDTAVDVAHLQDAVTMLAAGMDEIRAAVADQGLSIQFLRERVEMAEEQTEELATDTGEVIQDVATEIEQASEEVKPDEVPSTRGHWFFRKWGRS